MKEPLKYNKSEIVQKSALQKLFDNQFSKFSDQQVFIYCYR